MLNRVGSLFIVIALFAGACSDDDAGTGGELIDLGADGDAVLSNSIRIAVHNWSSQLVGAEVIGTLLEQAGYSVEYVEADTRAVYQSMCDGTVDIVHEIWQEPFGVAFQQQLDTGCVVDLVTHTAQTREEWWYPAYVGAQCPGLPDWEALNSCAAIFATPDTGAAGRFLTGPLGWLKGDAERIAALGMNFQVVHAESAAAMWAELDAAFKNQTPIVLFNWTPNYIEAVFEGSFVEFPEFDPDCRIDPEWGPNPALTHDCGNPADGYLKTGVSKQFTEQWPLAADLLARIDLSNAMLAGMAALVDVAGLTPSEAAAKWMEANPAIIGQWTTP